MGELSLVSNVVTEDKFVDITDRIIDDQNEAKGKIQILRKELSALTDVSEDINEEIKNLQDRVSSMERVLQEMNEDMDTVKEVQVTQILDLQDQRRHIAHFYVLMAIVAGMATAAIILFILLYLGII